MSARVSLGVPARAVGRNNQKRKMAIEVDLNVPPSDHSSDVGTSDHEAVVPEVQLVQPKGAPPPVTIDVDSLDDDVVVLSSPRAIAEVKNNLKRNRSRSVVVEVELESTSYASNNCNKRLRIPTNQPIINCESYEISNRNGTVNGNGRGLAPFRPMVIAPPPPPPPPPPPELALSCPVCMSSLVEETSTKCGHIFCKACIVKALSVQSKCPTCRRKLTKNSLIRIYLPKTS